MTLVSNLRLLDPGPLHITSTGRFANAGLLQAIVAGTPAMATVAWPSNNLAIYAPVAIPFRFNIARFLVANGSNLTGTVDVGIYSEAGLLLMGTGNQARAGATAIQYYGVTDRGFPPGRYYLALVASSTTGSYGAVQLANQYEARMAGYLQEALGATTLPASMTPVSFTGSNAFGFGFTQSDTL
jgi:hypothetical protein